MEKQELIFVPVPGLGHLVPTFEFANSLLNQYDHITVTVLMLKMPSASCLDPCVKAIADSNSRIRLIQLPEIVYPSDELMVKGDFITYLDAIIENYKPHVRTVVSNIVSSITGSKQSSQVPTLVIDLLFTTMIDIGNEFGVPSYIFSTSSAGFLSFLKSLPSRHKKEGREFRSNDPALSLPAFVNPVPVQVLPLGVFNSDGDYNATVKIANSYGDAIGILINTFVELEPQAINSLSDGQSPSIYHVGPVLSLKSQPHPELDRARWKQITEWLDEQPQSSVLFLCFGSMGCFSVPQVGEIALGLEKSGHRFLWCLRATPEIQGKNPEEMLPEGFLERIGERGIICNWAPQVEVLGHTSIGGFMSHCGWNSILESLWYGVPIVTLPLYADQQLNAFSLVKELGLAEELRMDYCKDHFVRADDVARAVKRVMQSDSVVRKRVKEMGEMARKAVMDGGSSYASIAKFIMDLKNSR